MLNMEAKTGMKPEEVIKKAMNFFGPGGYGLEVKEKSDTCATFEGGGGAVSITTCPEGKKTSVEIEAREWDYQVKEFLGSLK